MIKIGVMGNSSTGKTTLVKALADGFCFRGMSVQTISDIARQLVPDPSELDGNLMLRWKLLEDQEEMEASAVKTGLEVILCDHTKMDWWLYHEHDRRVKGELSLNPPKDLVEDYDYVLYCPPIFSYKQDNYREKALHYSMQELYLQAFRTLCDEPSFIVMSEKSVSERTKKVFEMLEKPPCSQWSVWIGNEIEGHSDLGEKTLFIRRDFGGSDFDLLDQVDRVWFCKEYKDYNVIKAVRALGKKVCVEVVPGGIENALPDDIHENATLYLKMNVKGLKNGDHICVGKPFEEESFMIGSGTKVTKDQYLADRKIK